MYYAKGNVGMKKTPNCSEEVLSLLTDHTEANTKIHYLTHHVLDESHSLCSAFKSRKSDLPIIGLDNGCENSKNHHRS